MYVVSPQLKRNLAPRTRHRVGIDYLAYIWYTSAMKSSIVAVTIAILAPVGLAFVPVTSLSSPHRSKTTMALQAIEPKHYLSAFMLGLGLSTQVAFANDVVILEQQQQQQISQYQYSSSVIVAEKVDVIDKFSLPSYDAAKGSTLIDINSDLETVNKRTLAQAKSNRETEDKSAEKLEADALRKAEKDGSSLFDSMIGESAKEAKARIEAEKAESRANRWKTF